MKHQVGTLSELESGPFAATVTNGDGEEITIGIFRSDVDNNVYALNDECTHMGASLSEGDVEDGCIECWAHNARFDLATGEAQDPAHDPAPTYPVSIEGDEIFVEVE